MIIVPLHKLTRSELNVRKTGAKDIADTQGQHSRNLNHFS